MLFRYYPWLNTKFTTTTMMSVELVNQDCTRVCAWCNVVLINGEATERYIKREDHQIPQVSHSICIPCSEELI